MIGVFNTKGEIVMLLSLEEFLAYDPEGKTV